MFFVFFFIFSWLVLLLLCRSIPAALFASRLCFIRFVFVFFLLFVVVLSDEPKQKQGRGLVDRKLVQAPQQFFFIAGRPKAALLFRFFGDFRCGALLFMVIHVIYMYKYKNR